MNLEKLVEELGLKSFGNKGKLSSEVKGAYVSDLLSDVMGNSEEGQVWITLQVHQNIIAVASMKNLTAIILVGGREPQAETLEKAEAEGVTLLGTNLSTFEVAGRLYKMLEA